MKKNILTLAIVFNVFIAVAQPNLMNYQGVARNAVGNVLPNQNIALKLSILDNAPNGTVVYSEARNVVTNAFGLFNVVVGSPGAINVAGTIATIPWAAGTKFLKVEIDPVGGNNFTNIGTTQLVSVPYAIYAAGAAPIGAAGGDLTGTYPNPTVAPLKITNAKIADGAVTSEKITFPLVKTQAADQTALIDILNTGSNGGGIKGQSESGVGVYGKSVSNFGVRGQSTTGSGVVAISESGLGLQAVSSTRQGVYGVSLSSEGVYGLSSTTSGVYGTGKINGVQGQSESGVGVYGKSVSGFGIKAESTNGAGVYAISESSYGVQGSSTNGEGVFGLSTNSQGVFGSSTKGTGVFGLGKINGVQGQSESGVGVYGKSVSGFGIKAESTNGAGVYAISESSYGVQGSSTNGEGVFGLSTNSQGVFGSSTKGTGVFGLGKINGVQGQSENGAGVFGESLNGTAVYGLHASLGTIGSSGIFENTEFTNPSNTLIATTNGTGWAIDAINENAIVGQSKGIRISANAGVALRVANGGIQFSATENYVSGAGIENADLIVKAAGNITLPKGLALDGQHIWIINSSAGSVKILNTTVGSYDIPSKTAKQFIYRNGVDADNWFPVQ